MGEVNSRPSWDTTSAPWLLCAECGAYWQGSHTCLGKSSTTVNTDVVVEMQVGWWCGGAGLTYGFEPLDHPCRLPNRMPVYVKVAPVPVTPSARSEAGGDPR